MCLTEHTGFKIKNYHTGDSSYTRGLYSWKSPCTLKTRRSKMYNIHFDIKLAQELLVAKPIVCIIYFNKAGNVAMQATGSQFGCG